jgi:alkylation response protein AidB-like acyl-CoA dehydrogenase
MSGKQPLVERATALCDEIASRAEEIERARRIPADLSQKMADAGFYRMFVPAAVGGLESSPIAGARVFETLARADASVAWVAFIGATSGSALAQIPEGAARNVFATPDTMIAGVFAPNGKAERVAGGFVAEGRWQWGSGCENAHWILGGCTLYERGEPMKTDAGNARRHMLLFPARDVEILDTWHVSGLRGTGSTDFRVQGVFVPDERVLGYPVREAPARPLVRFPHFTLLALGIGAVALGTARASIAELTAVAASKKRFGSSSTIASRAHSHLEVAGAEARLRSARAFYYEALEAAWRVASEGDEIPIECRRDLRLATTNAVNESVRVVDAMYTLAGGVSVYDSSRLQRQFRDIHVATQHIMVAPSTLETVGRLLLGVDADTSSL